MVKKRIRDIEVLDQEPPTTLGADDSGSDDACPFFLVAFLYSH
jgi:hypothetical protein